MFAPRKSSRYQQTYKNKELTFSSRVKRPKIVIEEVSSTPLMSHLDGYEIDKEDQIDSRCLFDFLPKDLLYIEVIRWLDLRSLLKLSTTCKQFQRLCDSEELWKGLVNYRYVAFSLVLTLKASISQYNFMSHSPQDISFLSKSTFINWFKLSITATKNTTKPWPHFDADTLVQKVKLKTLSPNN
jgi:hypothetical protein